jgi:hypothetical protein
MKNIVIDNWLVYGLEGADGLLVVNGQIQTFSTTNQAKAYRTACGGDYDMRLVPMFLNDVKALAAPVGKGVDLNGKALAIGDAAGVALSGC